MSEGEIKDAGVNENSLYSGTNDDLDQDIGKKSKFLHDQVSRAYEENYTVNMVATEKSISHESMTRVATPLYHPATHVVKKPKPLHGKGPKAKVKKSLHGPGPKAGPKRSTKAKKPKPLHGKGPKAKKPKPLHGKGPKAKKPKPLRKELPRNPKQRSVLNSRAMH